MTTTKDKQKVNKKIYSPSVNIVRDQKADINYIPTVNSKQVYTQIINDYQVGIRCFNIVGAYGTGKSAFLWALSKDITGERMFFEKSCISPINGYRVFNIIGEYDSFISCIASTFNLSNKKDIKPSAILSAIREEQNRLAKQKKGLILLVDEFGKFLEYASKNNPGSELYFIQQLAEFVNSDEKDILFISTLHQDFSGYSRDLTKSQQNEWDKVKGRLKEITFNEPVEQLLFLAASRLREIGTGIKPKDFSQLFKSIEKAKAFPLRDFFFEQFAEDLLPFDILSAAILTLALQKHGQNERSLFSFIEANDHLGLKDFSKTGSKYYNIPLVYDYLIHNYHSVLTTPKYNSNFAQWAAIRTAVELVEGNMKTGISEGILIVKTIGLLNIFASASIKLDKDFLTEYAKISFGLDDPSSVIKKLEGLRIIRFARHINKYVLAEGTDLDIELAIDEAGNLIEKVTSVVHHLNKYFEFPYVSAKAAYYKLGTPRFFQFQLTEAPFTLVPYGEVDGFINLIFSDTIKESEIVDASKNCKEAILLGWYKNTTDIKNLLFEIEKIKRVKEDHSDDRVAVRELNQILQHQVKLLNHYVIGSLYSPKVVKWFFNGIQVEIIDQKSFNRCLSDICDQVYPNTPTYRNEMINKTKLSGAIAGAKRNFILALTTNMQREDIGFDPNKFPPEKTIYRSLLKETKIHRKNKGGDYVLESPLNDDGGLKTLWKHCEVFLDTTKYAKRPIQDLVDMLQAKPYKLKLGFIDFWLITFLWARREDFALFHNDIYIPQLTSDTLELVLREPKDYSIKKFNIDGIKLDLFNSYRTLLNQSKQQKLIGKSFIETIRPFLSFYKKLPEYAKTTKRLSKPSLALRDAIAYARDPEECFFDKFPKAFGYSIEMLQKDNSKLAKYVMDLEDGIKEVRTSFDKLINRVEEFLASEITGIEIYPAYKTNLENRFLSVKRHLLLPHQKSFYLRVYSEVDDNRSWLTSLAQACVNKPLELFSDDDEPIFLDKLKDTIHELDNLNEIGESDFDETKEIAFKLEVTSFVQGLQKNLVRLPISKNKDLIQLQSLVKAKLGKDRLVNIATLAKILEELLKDEKG